MKHLQTIFRGKFSSANNYFSFGNLSLVLLSIKQLLMQVGLITEVFIDREPCICHKIPHDRNLFPYLYFKFIRTS